MTNREEVIEITRLGFGLGVITTAAATIITIGDVDKSLDAGLIIFTGMTTYFITTCYFRLKPICAFEDEPEPAVATPKVKYIDERTKEDN